MARQVGLKDIYIATVTQDDSGAATYDTPSKLERAISAKLHQRPVQRIFIQMIQWRM